MSQPLPKPGQEDVISKVIRDLIDYGFVAGEGKIAGELADLAESRAEAGVKTYGTRLQTHNGRDVKRDLLEECMDAVNYGKQLLMEDENGKTHILYGKLLDVCFSVAEYMQLKSAPVTGSPLG